MTESERIEAVLKSAEWWDGEQIAVAAKAWYLDWHQEIGRMPVSKWEAARRVGSGVSSFTQFGEEWETYLKGPKRENRERSGGVVDRDKGRRGWGQPQLADDLWAAIDTAALPDESERVHAFQEAARSLGATGETQLKDWLRLQQARAFVGCLLMFIRAEWDPKEKK